MERDEATQEVLTRLETAPGRIAAAVAGWDGARLRAAPAAGEWSAAEILAHLRASDDILAYRAYMLLARDQPPLSLFDERRWAEVAGYAQSDFHQSLAAFTLRRAELVRMRAAAPPEAWARTGMHESRGPITLLEVLRVLADHEEEHLTSFPLA
ncbi:MAG: DinB family protein [Ktedonobacterales bacterium]|nr:DinB family protein [Ktedonobacterales bacterium]